MFISRLAKAFSARKVDYAIVGGYAVALHGAVRGTVDFDIVLRLSRDNFLAAEAALKGLGLEPRLPVQAAQVFDFREEYIKNKNLVAWSFYNPLDPTEVVDIIITHDLGKKKIERIKADEVTVSVLAVEDLIAMKKESGRPQDLEDVKALRELQK